MFVESNNKKKIGLMFCLDLVRPGFKQQKGNHF